MRRPPRVTSDEMKTASTTSRRRRQSRVQNGDLNWRRTWPGATSTIPTCDNMTGSRLRRAAAGDYFEELDVWESPPATPREGPADLTPLLGAVYRARSGRARRSCSTFNSARPRPVLSVRPRRAAMVDSAMFYLVGTFYSASSRATYPALGFPHTRRGRDLRGGRRHEDEGPAGRRGRLNRARGRPRLVLDGRPFIAETIRRSGRTCAGPRRSNPACHRLDFPAWTDAYFTRMEGTLGDTYTEPAGGRAGLRRAREDPERMRPTRRGPRSEGHVATPGAYPRVSR